MRLDRPNVARIQRWFIAIAGITLLGSTFWIFARPDSGPDVEQVSPGGAQAVEVLTKTEAREVWLRDRVPPWEKREQYARALRVGPDGRVPAGAMQAAREYKATMPQAGPTAQQTVPGNLWTPIGPAPIVYTAGNVSGRVKAIVPLSSNLIYLAAASGGVWKTTNGGQNWIPTSDFEATLALSTLAVDPQDSRIIYAGTGEGGAGIASYGAGVLKSIDGGESWTLLGQSRFDRTDGGERISKIALDPTPVSSPRTQRVIYAASTNGLWRSPDGGLSWKRAMRGNFTDVVMDPSASDRVFAAIYRQGIWRYEYGGALSLIDKLTDENGNLPTQRFGRINLAVVAHPSGGSPTLFASMHDLSYGKDLKGIWKTSNGTHWTRLTGHPTEFADGEFTMADWPEGEAPGVSGQNDNVGTANVVPVGDVVGGRISSTTDVDVFRFTLIGRDAFNAEICADRKGTGLHPKISLLDATGNPVQFKGEPYVKAGGLKHPNGQPSKDGRMLTGWKNIPSGTYHIKVETADATTGDYQLSILGIDLNCQCDYDQVIATEPGNPNVLYMGLVSFFRSTDGGTNWTEIQEHGGTNWVHQDIHAVAFDPANSNTVYVGSDGGIWKSTNRGDNWVTLNTDLEITQVYQGVSQHRTDPAFMLVGTQDNAVNLLQNGVWTWLGSGDGAFTAIASQNEYYYSYQGLDIQKYDPVGNPQKPHRAVQNGLGVQGVMFVAPFVMDPDNSQVLIAGGGAKDPDGVLRYLVYRTETGGDLWFNNSTTLGSPINALAFAPSDSTTYYAGTLFGQVWGTTTGGVPWTDLSWLNHPRAAVTDIAVDPNNAGRLYVTYGGFRHGHVFRSPNGGTSWVDISSAPHANPNLPIGISEQPLPDVPVFAIVVDPGFPDTLFVGTDLGIYRTTDGGVHWEVFDYGLPNVTVSDLVLSTTTGPAGKLRAATYGRGVWELALSNDSCDNATVIGDGTFTGTLRGASAEGTTTCDPSSSSPDTWYRYTATCDGELRLNTCGSDFDTVASVHFPVCPGTTVNEFDCNDDCTGGAPCGSPRSCSAYPVIKNITYLIRVAGYAGAAGDFTLNVSCDVPNDQCEDADPIGLNTVVVGSTRGAGEDFAPICADVSDTAPGVWYTVSGTGNTMTASLCGSSNFDTQLSVYCAGCVEKRCIAANDDACDRQSQVSWCAAPGRIYHLLVHGFDVDAGGFDLEVTDDGQNCGPFYLNCNPANQQCAAAAELDVFGLFGDNTNASTSAGVSCALSGADVWYEYDSQCYGFATIDTCGASGTLADTVLSVHDGCGGAELSCNDDSCGARSMLTLPQAPGTSWAVRVADYGSNLETGTFPLDVDVSLAPVEAPWPGLYVSDGHDTLENQLFRLDPFDGVGATVGPLNRSGIAGMAWTPGLGLMYAINDEIDQNDMATVDLDTGSALSFGGVGFTAVRGLAFDPATTTLYGVDGATNQLITIDPFSGAGGAIGLLGFTGVEGLAYDPDTDTLYGSDVTTDQLIVISTLTGAGTAVGTFGGDFDRIEGLAFDTVEKILYGAQKDLSGASGRLVRIDTATGLATQVGGAHANLGPEGLAFVPGLPDATEGKPYDETVPVSGGCPAYIFANPAGLPPGLSLDAEGKITGTPTAPGLFTITFTVDDHDISTPFASGTQILRVHPSHDTCADSVAVGDGSLAFSNLYSTTDGPDEVAACNFSGDTQIGSDVWYCYEATCTGTLTVDTCDADYDSKLAIYSGCDCPSGSSASACNDDFCGSSGLASQLTTSVVAGELYMIRVGGFGGAQGSGALGVSCAGPPAGACCIDSGCTQESEERCLEMGGSFLGDGSVCEPDTDGDGAIDACDDCPGDGLKFEPGVCGCGIFEDDLDGDGEPGCIDLDDDDDGVPDDDDEHPNDPFKCLDADGDGCDDCVTADVNAGNDGTDLDSDGICAVGDCNDANSNTYPGAAEFNDGEDNQCPGDPGYGLVDEIADAGFYDAFDNTRYSWTEQSGAAVYHVARADSPDFTTGCIPVDSPDPWWHDPDAPNPGSTFYYLVRAGEPHPGSWGVDSDGAERMVICF